MEFVIDSDKSFLDFGDLSTARFAYKAYSKNNNLSAVNFFLTYVTSDSNHENEAEEVRYAYFLRFCRKRVNNTGSSIKSAKRANSSARLIKNPVIKVV